MTGFLVRLFIKNHEKTGDKKVRAAYGALAGTVSIAANTLLCAVKFMIGMLTGSVAVQADAVNNLADIGSNVVALVGVRLAAKPADKEHPYGHARMEYIAALAISFLIILVGFRLGRESIDKVMHPTAVDFTPATIIALALSIGVKLWMGMFTANIGRRIDSAAMSAATMDSICDSISTGAILMASLISYFFSVNLDGYIGILVTAFVLYSGMRLIKETISPIMGEAPSPELVSELEERIKSYEGVNDVHDILIHSYGPGVTIASAHAEVPASGSVLEMHELIDRIEEEVGGRMGMLLTIHMDPVELDNPLVQRARAALEKVVAGLGTKVRFHDFRMVPGENRSNLIFDIVVPFGMSGEELSSTVHKIKAELKEADPTYCCVIKVDRDYSGTVRP